MRHRGNLIAREDHSNPIDPFYGANITSLDDLIHTASYLENGSDIIALMVLEHKSQMHNHITKASYEYRLAINYQKSMIKALVRSLNIRLKHHKVELSLWVTNC